MARRSRRIELHLQKAREAALGAVENYNRIGTGFRTRTYVLLMTVAWTSCFHAIFYNRKVKPWYVKKGTGKAIRYEREDGEPRHWDLSECIRQYWGGNRPAPRRNIEFFLGLRNKIEHRFFPELDPALYGECQAMLLNFEDLLLQEFGKGTALLDQIGVALQFSAIRPQQQEEALRRLQGSALGDIREYVETFRAGLPPEILESSQYSLRVFLIPKLENTPRLADLSIEFVQHESTSPITEELRRVTALIREKRIPVVSEGLLKPMAVVKKVKARIPFKFTTDTHTRSWKYYKVRPPAGSENPDITRSEFCVYDQLADGYGYTEAWVNYLSMNLADPFEYEAVTGRSPICEISGDSESTTPSA